MTVSRETIRNVFLANGFTIKPGHDDLKPYVYDAAEMLLKLARVSLPVADAPHERESFEKHPNFRGMDFARAAGAPELYDSPYLNGAWDAWQVRAAMLSLRDVFARTAIESLLTRPFTKDEKGRPFLDWVSDAAYELADNMLAERGPEQVEQFEVAAVVCRSKDGDWYVDALHPSRFGESGYMEEGAELTPVAQCKRVLAGYEAAYQDRWEKARALQSEMDGLVEELDAMRAALSAPPAAPSAMVQQGLQVVARRLEELCEKSLRGKAAAEVREVWREVVAMLSAPPAAEMVAQTVDIQHCVFIGKNADGSSPVNFEVKQQVPLRMGSLQSIKMHGWQCIGPLLTDEDKALIAPAPPAAGVPEAVHVLRKAYEGSSAGLFNSGAPKHLWSAAMLELFESLDEEVQEEARETVMAHSDMRAVAAIDSVIALLAAPTPPASEQQQADRFYVHERVAVGEHAFRLVVMPDPKRILAPGEFLAELLRLNPLLAREQQQAVVMPEYGEPIACPDCNGTGEWPHDRGYPCPRCSGDGVAELEAGDAQPVAPSQGGEE